MSIIAPQGRKPLSADALVLAFAMCPLTSTEVERHLGLRRAFDVHVQLALRHAFDESREPAHGNPPAWLSLGAVLKELNKPL